MLIPVLVPVNFYHILKLFFFAVPGISDLNKKIDFVKSCEIINLGPTRNVGHVAL